MATVLVIDDQPHDRLLFRSILESAGHRVTECESASEALRTARLQPPDAAICDVLMPGMDGFQLCRAWRLEPLLRPVPILLCSASYLEPEYASFARELGSVTLVPKPVEPRHLRRVLAAVLRTGNRERIPAIADQWDEAGFHRRHAAAVQDKVSSKILDLEHANQRLEHERRSLRGLFENMPLPVWVRDVQTGRVLEVNEATIRTYGWSRSELIGASSRRLGYEPGPDCGEETEFQASHLLHDGRRIDVKVNRSPLFFEGRHAELLTVLDITEQLAAEERRRGHVRQLEGVIRGTVSSVAHLSELRDPYTAGHGRRVGDLAAAIGLAMGFDPERAQGLQIAGSLHDVGKISVPAEILTKPSFLTAIEHELVRQHATNGYEILQHVDFPWPIAEVARQHHERLDGSGYPRGLRGDEILLEARIVGIADVVEAVSSHRPYRAGLGIDHALKIIEGEAGSRLDRDAVQVCIALFRDGQFRFETGPG